MSQARLLLVARRNRHLEPLRTILRGQPDLHIAGDALTLRETFNRAEELDPDLAIVSADMTAAPEFEAIVKLFAALDTRWLEFRTAAHGPGGPPRPGAPHSGLFRLVVDDDPAQVLAQIRSVLRGPRNRRAPAAPPPVQAAPGGATTRRGVQRIVLIGSSTGGVEALMTVLSGFPADCPPTAIVQHTGPGYGESLARLLDRNCAPEVLLACDRLPMQPGRVILAAGSRTHMALTRTTGAPYVQLRAGAPVSGHCPSVDVLFSSAVSFAPKTIGVLLTGMGRDGAEGLLKLRQAGAHTLAQDEASSLVYGMPRAAWDNGAVISQLPIGQLGSAILKESSMRAAGSPKRGSATGG